MFVELKQPNFNRKMLELYLSFPKEMIYIVSSSKAISQSNRASAITLKPNKKSTFCCFLPWCSSSKYTKLEEIEIPDQNQFTFWTTLFVAFALKEYIDNSDTKVESESTNNSYYSTTSLQSSQSCDTSMFSLGNSTTTTQKAPSNLTRALLSEQENECQSCKKHKRDIKRLAHKNKIVLSSFSSICKANKRLQNQVGKYEAERMSSNNIFKNDTNEEDSPKNTVVGENELKHEIKCLKLKVLRYDYKLAKMNTHVATMKMWGTKMKSKYIELEEANKVLLEKLVKMKEYLAYLQEYQDNNIPTQTLVRQTPEPEPEPESESKPNHEDDNVEWHDFFGSFSGVVD